MGNALTAVIVLNGVVAGAWNRNLKNNRLEIKLKPFRKLSESGLAAVKAQIARYGKFSGIPAVQVD